MERSTSRGLVGPTTETLGWCRLFRARMAGDGSRRDPEDAAGEVASSIAIKHCGEYI